MKHIKSIVFLAIMLLIYMPDMALSEGGSRAKKSELKLKENIDETERWKLYYETIGREGGWKKIKEKNGIKIYTRLTPVSPLKAFRGVMEIEADIDQLITFVSEPYAYPEYIYLCREAEVLKYQTDNDYYFRSIVVAPWPVKIRDSVTHTVWIKDPKTGKVIMDCIGVPELIPEQKGYIRVPMIFVTLYITPGENGIHEMVFEGVIEAGGWIPTFVGNYCIWWTPYKTLLNVKTKRPFERERYKNKKVKLLDSNPYIKMHLSEKASLPKAIE
jgi:hypothetical protein